MLQAPANQETLEIALMAISSVLLTTTGFFLKQTWDEIKEVKTKVNEHDNKIIKLETILEERK